MPPMFLNAILPFIYSAPAASVRTPVFHPLVSFVVRHNFLQQDPPPTMFPVQLSHFQALLLFAAIISVAFGFVSRRKPLARLKYILWSLLLFLLIGIGIGWAMYPFSR